MFTGIIEAVGKVASIKASGGDAIVRIASGKLDLSDVKLGDSIATNGVCLTVTALHGDGYSADVSSETLKRTGFAKLKAGSPVNLEKALLPTTRLGGHLVSGHVDGVASVESRHSTGRAIEFWLKAPAELARYIAEKGSVTVDGISLTVNAVEGQRFLLTIVPHTQGETTIAGWKAGSEVNLEVDLLARYIERLLAPSPDKKETVTLDLLARSGFLK
ncbi:riboflavin synthase [Gallaecimonas pentaromativorans]|uniref:Riboflavin synthase n=1 Tax=Gallaecimonas pentaromativorans TaxID=584787 RepID=A0A3N1NRN4_9GAMM|nr:riboflavin synthase [Gallaecimonas pentaromativorans]ROQ18835.1 riboflavin synthase alpha chain [Gallaecimonas pentaromativorans]